MPAGGTSRQQQDFIFFGQFAQSVNAFPFSIDLSAIGHTPVPFHGMRYARRIRPMNARHRWWRHSGRPIATDFVCQFSMALTSRWRSPDFFRAGHRWAILPDPDRRPASERSTIVGGQAGWYRQGIGRQPAASAGSLAQRPRAKACVPGRLDSQHRPSRRRKEFYPRRLARQFRKPRKSNRDTHPSLCKWLAMAKEDIITP